MINTLVVDDEAPAREELIYILEKYENINIAGGKHPMEKKLWN